MLNLPFEPKYMVGPVILIALMVTLNLLEPLTTEHLGLFPALVHDGEWWRIVTGQLLHTNINHLYLNISGVLLVWALHGEYYTVKQYLFVVTSCLFLVGLLLMVFANYTHYAGLSGILHSLLIYGAIVDIIKKDKTGWLLLAGVVAKVCYENIFGASEQTANLIGAAVATEAHLIGVFVGATVCCICYAGGFQHKLKR